MTDPMSLNLTPVFKDATKDDVCALIVTYHPEIDRFRLLLSAIKSQVGAVIIVDNAPDGDKAMAAAVAEELRETPVEIVTLGENLGIAAAMNVGIQRNRLKYILLLDHDSVPAANMVEQLSTAFAELSASGRKIAAVGPTYHDEITNTIQPFQIQRPGRMFYSVELPKQPLTRCLSLISSGSLIPAAVLADVGAMMEELFIDNVDIEWGFRAQSKGYELVGVRGATMLHRRGDVGLRVWALGWRTINHYGPLRMYYQFRNWITVLYLTHIPLRWKIRSTIYWFGMLYGHLFYTKNKKEYAEYIFRGIYHGFRRKLGPYNNSSSPV